MKSILSDLFLTRNKHITSKRIEELNEEKRIATIAEKLQKSLNDEQVQLFLSYDENIGREKAEIESDAYCLGLRDGASLMMELFSDK